MAVASHLWGCRWTRKRVEFRPDKMAVVNALRSGISKDPNMIVLLRSLSLSAARHSFALTASHRAGGDNCIADALSHFDFLSSRTTCSTAAAPISPSLLAQLPVI